MKHILFSFILFFITITAFAQSDPLCPQSGVPSLTVNACIANPYSIPNSFGLEADATVPIGTACVVANDNKRDGWFQFTATSVNTTIVGTVIAGYNLAIDVYTGSCGSMVEEGAPPCQTTGGNGVSETTTLTTVIGTTYFIRLIKSKDVGSGTMSGTISVLSPQANDDCSGAITLIPTAPAFPTTCTQTCGQTYYSSGSSPTTACTGSANDDVWYEFMATQALHVITVGGSALFNPVVEVLSGSCGSLLSLKCEDVTPAGGVENLNYSPFIPGNTYFIRVYDPLSIPAGTFQFYICVTSPLLPTCPASMGGAGGGVVSVSLPYTGTGLTTTGRGDEFTSGNTVTCGSSAYLQGLDGVYIFTPSSSGNISVTLTSGSSNVGVMLYDDCPFIGSGSNCVDFSQSASGNQSFCVDVVSSKTYYLIVDRTNAGGAIPSYTLDITAPATGNNGATCATAVPISSIPYSTSPVLRTTLCKGDDYNISSAGSCASLYESGEDMVFSYTATAAQCLIIGLNSTSSVTAGFTVYDGCPSSASSNCLGYLGGGNVSSNFTLPSAGTYYIVVDSWSPPGAVSFHLTVDPAPGASPNDYPCSAITLPLGSPLPGDNRCSNALLEPGNASCWTGGTLNTVWYRVTPSGTSLNIRTISGTLINTQIALYQGSCSGFTQVTPVGSTCNRDEIGCTSTTLNSQMTVTGLTAGQNYYIRVDGEQDLTGTFQITAIDGNSGPPFTSQDCGGALAVCPSNIVSSGYSGIGNYCDFSNTSNCIPEGEINSVWYTIVINSAGNLTFDIIPNNWPGAPSVAGTDYDFAIWEIGQSGLSCSQLTNATPVSCNSNVLGVTGCFTGGNSPAAFPGFNNSYEPSIPVSSGQIYRLMISNNTGNSTGFTFNITSSPGVILYPPPPPTLTWSGSSNSSWDVSTNWGSCSVPSCAINVVCTSGPSNQPVISTNQSVKDVTIQAGSTLTINPNVTLSVCGNFTNSGNLVTGAGSTIKFIGCTNQFIAVGNYTGANAFANLTMQKPCSTLTLQSNIDIKENDSLLSGIFQPNSKYIRVKKNFYNANGIFTHTPVGAGANSTYEFNGSGPQTFTNIGSEIDLNNVFMNQSVTSTLTLNTDPFNNMNVKGLLTLTNGKIITGAREVVMKNTANASILNFSANSYVEGKLRRFLNGVATGAFEFPVGHSAKGYQRAQINFTSATQIPQLLVYFTPWPGLPPFGPVSSECNTANFSLTPALNNGYWTMVPFSNPNTGIYNMTLYNQNYSNPMLGWTVMKSSAQGSGVWTPLVGTCVVSSKADSTKRNGMQGFTDFASAQSTVKLPIELLRFDALVQSSGVLTLWETASETNNNYFNIEKSTNGYNFENIGTVPGAGTSTQNHIYSFPDPDPGIGIIYYRLKQVDFDGGFSYSDIVAVKLSSILNEISIYPNPANSLINFEFESTTNSMVNIQILDIIGKKVMEELKEENKGLVTIQMDVIDLPKGVYFLKIIENDVIYKGKFIKLDE